MGVGIGVGIGVGRGVGESAMMAVGAGRLGSGGETASGVGVEQAARVRSPTNNGATSSRIICGMRRQLEMVFNRAIPVGIQSEILAVNSW